MIYELFSCDDTTCSCVQIFYDKYHIQMAFVFRERWKYEFSWRRGHHFCSHIVDMSGPSLFCARLWYAFSSKTPTDNLCHKFHTCKGSAQKYPNESVREIPMTFCFSRQKHLSTLVRSAKQSLVMSSIKHVIHSAGLTSSMKSNTQVLVTPIK